MSSNIVDLSWQMNSAGEIESFYDPYKNVTTELWEKAVVAEEAIKAKKAAIEKNFMGLAYDLETFEGERYYLGVGSESFKQWCETSGIDLGYRVAHDLIRIKRELIPTIMEQSSLDEVEVATRCLEIGVSRLREMLPLLRDGGEGQTNIKRLVCGDEDQAPADELRFVDVKNLVKKMRGQEAEVGEPHNVIFKAVAAPGEATTRLQISGFDGVGIEQLGYMNVPNKWMPQAELWFGKHIEFEV